jgi:hypothetical protein
LKTNSGDIIQICKIKGLSPEINAELDFILLDYKQKYIDTLTKINHKETISGNIYPNYKEDLLEKSWKYLELRTGKLQNQNENDIKEIFKRRIEGLKTCVDKEKKDPDKLKGYYSNYYPFEYKHEIQLNDKLSTLSSSDYNLGMCENIFWGFPTNQNIKKNINPELLKQLIKNAKETEFLRTFLPYEYYNQDNTLNIELLKQKNDWMDLMPFRQTIFGFYGDLKDKIYLKINQLYECMNIQSNYNGELERCNNYVEWCQILNNLYTYCSIKKNKALFPVRFIFSDIYYKGLNVDFNNKTPLNININKLFENYEFIGFLVIKFQYDKNTKRLFIILLFKNKTKHLFYNSVKGEYNNVSLLSLSGNHINFGDLFKRPPITHDELKELFYKYKDKMGLKYFANEKSPNHIFITNRNSFSENDNKVIRQLNLIELTSLSHKLGSSRRSYKLSRLPHYQSGGKININSLIKLQKTKEYNLFNNIITSIPNIYETFFNKNLFIYSIFKLIILNQKWTWNKDNYNNLLKYLAYIYPYTLIDSNSVSMGSYFKSKNKLNIYQPLSLSYYQYHEIFHNYKLLSKVKKNDKILLIGYSILCAEYLMKELYSADIYIVSNNNEYLDRTLQIMKIIKNSKLNYQIINNHNIYKLLEYPFPKSKFIFYNIINLNIEYGLIFSHSNIINNFIGVIIGLKQLEF